MTTLNKTLMTSAAALVIAGGSAFAQSADTNMDADTGASVSVGDVEVGTTATNNVGADIVTDPEAVLETAADNAADLKSELGNVGVETDTALDESATSGTETDMAEGTMEGDMSADSGMSSSQMADSGMDDLDAAAEMQISSLIGASVWSENGNDVGEIDSFVEQRGELMAIVGIGGFLGLGEHDVAVSLDQMAVAETTMDGEPTSFIITGQSEDELEAMPEFDNMNAEMIDGDMSLRSAMEG